MDAVPYAFCSSVVATLHNVSVLQSQFSSKIWQNAAAEDNSQNRLGYELRVGYNNGVWSYQIDQGEGHLSFSEFKKLNKRRVRILRICVYPFIFGTRSSFEEIRNLVKLSLPCVNMAKLELVATRDFPQEELLNVLSIYRNAAFREVYIAGSRVPVSDFVLALNWDYFKKLQLCQRECSSELKKAIGEFAVQNKCGYLRFQVNAVEFDFEFFKELFDKQIVQTERLIFNFSFDIAKLKDFKKDLLNSSEKLLQWQRADGVRVEVKHFDRNYLLVGLYLPARTFLSGV